MSLILTAIGCGRPAATHSSIHATHLVASMSDERILRSIGSDPAAMALHREQGKDGYTLVYSNKTTLIYITRSLVSDSRVLRLKPEAQEWILEK